MVHIYTFCDKTLTGRKTMSAKILCEVLFKLNLKIEAVSIHPHGFDFSSLSFKNKDTYFLLMQKSSNVLNSVLAELSGGELIASEPLKKVVGNYYSKCNLPMDSAAELEWLIPKGAVAITNPQGKTQGYSIKIGDATVFVLPAGEQELKSIISDCLMDYLESNFASVYKSETYKTFGLEEAHIQEVIKDLIKNKDKVYISVISQGLASDIVIKAKDGNPNYEKYRREVYQRLNKYIYSVQDKNLSDYFVELIQKQNISFAVVGDMAVNNILSSINSEVYKNICDCVILPNVACISKFLSQNNINLQDPRLVYSLAVKMLERSNAELVLVCISDILSSKSGTAYIAIGNKIKIDIYKNQFSGESSEIIQNISNTTLFYLIKKLQLNDIKTL